MLVRLRPSPAEEETPLALQDLLTLAYDRTPEARRKLLLGVLALCDTTPPTGEVSHVLGEIFLSLALQVERDIRRVLSLKLATVDWAPRTLVNLLALDEIEIARPVLAASPILQDDDLLKVLIESTLEHQIEVARRPRLGARVADAIIERGEPATLTALASNRTAEISLDGIRRLVEHSRRIAALRAPLIRHPRLTQRLAEDMYRWVGEALRQSLCARFPIDEARLEPLIDQAVSIAHDSVPLLPPANDDVERDEMERRLVDKLLAAGQLRAGYLIRSVRERRVGLFVHGLAALGGFSVSQIRQAMTSATPEALYYACAAVGIDRAVFPALLTELRVLNRRLPGDGGKRVWRDSPVSASEASLSFRTMIAA